MYDAETKENNGSKSREARGKIVPVLMKTYWRVKV
jgi:hypothetical protein